MGRSALSGLKSPFQTLFYATLALALGACAPTSSSSGPNRTSENAKSVQTQGEMALFGKKSNVGNALAIKYRDGSTERLQIHLYPNGLNTSCDILLSTSLLSKAVVDSVAQTERTLKIVALQGDEEVTPEAYGGFDLKLDANQFKQTAAESGTLVLSNIGPESVTGTIEMKGVALEETHIKASFTALICTAPL